MVHNLYAMDNKQLTACKETLHTLITMIIELKNHDIEYVTNTWNGKTFNINTIEEMTDLLWDFAFMAGNTWKKEKSIR